MLKFYYNRKSRTPYYSSPANPYEIAYVYCMEIKTASEARKNIYRLLDDTAAAHAPVLITGPRANAVLVGEEDWNAIQETLHLISIPGMRESIREGMKTPAGKCSEKPG